MRSPRFHAAIAALPLSLWLAFHLWEQWAVFAGRDAWMARMSATSRGPLAIVIELAVIVLPLVVWSAIAVRTLVTRGAMPGVARDEDRGVTRAIGRLAPAAAIGSIVFLAVHVGAFWAPKLWRGDDVAAQWIAITHLLGRPEMLVVHAIGLAAIALHLAAAIPAALGAWLGESASSRRSAMLVSTTFALCAWLLAVQLVGWLGTGAGTFWSIDVVEQPDAP